MKHLDVKAFSKLYKSVVPNDLCDKTVSEMNNLKFVNEKNELLEAMVMISKTNKGPKKQFNSFGCSIKWK